MAMKNPPLSENEVLKNRYFGMPTTRMTRHQRVAFTGMIKIAYEGLLIDKNQTIFEYDTNSFFELIGIKKERKGSHLFSKVFIDEDGWEDIDEQYSLQAILSDLIRKIITFRHKDSTGKIYKFQETTMISQFTLTREKIVFSLSPWIMDRVLVMDSGYILKMPIISSFKNTYSVALFEQMEQRLKWRRWEVKVSVLRQILGMELTEHKRFTNFRKWVLEKAKKEINEKTNYTLAYELIKKGRSIDKIIFTWHIAKDDDPYTQWKSFIRTTFIETPLLKSKVGGSAEQHLIKVNSKGLLYNQYNSDYVYSSEEAKVIWKYMFDNQEQMLIKNKTKGDDASIDSDNVKDYSTFIGKDYIFDNDLYPNIILITPVKNKLKVKFYDGNTFILTEAELTEGVKF
jgi:hypothetical protein